MTVEDSTISAADLRGQLAVLLREAEAAAAAEPVYAPRLLDSVIRPLTDVLLTLGVSGSAGELPFPVNQGASAADRLWALTKNVALLASAPDATDEVIEAASALEDLTLRAVRTGASDQDTANTLVADRMSELAGIVAGERARIQVALNGPYLAVGADTVTNYLGEPIPTTPHMALCRCGGSKIKPFCDGTHAKIGFKGDKAPDRVPDQRDTYEGTSVTIYDNRGLCQHSGFCTDRLKTVFHSGSEPFVTPSGGRMDEIINAARNCPSGALSYGVAGREMREVVDQYDRPPHIEVSKDGPYRITGGIPLTEPNGEPVVRPQGASEEHYALCRCGGSKNKPFCSGTHWYVNFVDPPMSEEPTVFEWAGGFPAFLRTTRLFYQKYVPADPLLAPLFADMSPDHPERVASWLSEVFAGKGGEPFYSSQYGGYSRMIGEHIGKMLTEQQRSRWAQLMVAAADEAMMPADADFRASFTAYIEWGTRLAVENSQQESHPPMNMPMPHWWWACDATPWSRVNALAPEEEEEEDVAAPAAEEPLSFDKNIKTLFRKRDRMSMKFVFDLWEYDDVSTHADEILNRVRNGSMPCDGTWPAEKVDAFARWIEAGKPA
jgi:CDGSH-type Zn-finger protein/truncated hemoglobin YjbI